MADFYFYSFISLSTSVAGTFMHLAGLVELYQNNFPRHVEKVNNAENEMMVASSVSKLCITSVNLS